MHLPAAGIFIAFDKAFGRLTVASCACVQGEDSLSTEARRNATFLFHAHLRATLAAKRVLSEYRLTQEAFAWLVGEIETRFQTVRLHSLFVFALAGAGLWPATAVRPSDSTQQPALAFTPAAAAPADSSSPSLTTRCCNRHLSTHLNILCQKCAGGGLSG